MDPRFFLNVKIDPRDEKVWEPLLQTNYGLRTARHFRAVSITNLLDNKVLFATFLKYNIKKKNMEIYTYLD